MDGSKADGVVRASALPSISVVTPSYNQGKFIGDAIASVVGQGYPNLEHLILDNCSGDGTAEAVRRHMHDSLRFIVEPDSGQSEALNKGIAMARGDWILWLNADDYLLPGAIDGFVEAIRNHPTANFVHGHLIFVDAFRRFLKVVYQLPYNPWANAFGTYAPPSTCSLFSTELLRRFPLEESCHFAMDRMWFLDCRHELEPVLIDRLVGAFRLSGENKTAQRITTGRYLPEQDAERLRFRQKVYGQMPRAPQGLQSALYTVGRRAFRLWSWAKKLRHLRRYLRNRREGAQSRVVATLLAESEAMLSREALGDGRKERQLAAR